MFDTLIIIISSLHRTGKQKERKEYIPFKRIFCRMFCKYNHIQMRFNISQELNNSPYISHGYCIKVLSKTP